MEAGRHDKPNVKRDIVTFLSETKINNWDGGRLLKLIYKNDVKYLVSFLYTNKTVNHPTEV